MAPKVRPRPRARQHEPEVDIISSGSPGGSGSGTQARASTSKSTTPTRVTAMNSADKIVDNDDFFIRNTGAMWKRNFLKSAKRTRGDEEQEKNEDKDKNGVIDLSSSSEHSFTDEDDDNPASSSPVYGENEDGSMPERPRRRRKRANNIKQHPLPEWTNPRIRGQKMVAQGGQHTLVNASETFEQHFEDDLDSQVEVRDRKDDSGRGSSHVELTPPPTIISRTTVTRPLQNVYEQNENEEEVFDLTETVNLNPTLLAIRENMKKNPAPQTVSAGTGPEIIDIKCKIIINTRASKKYTGMEQHDAMQFGELNKSFRYRRADSFESLFRYLAQKDVLNTQLDGVVMTYERHRVFTGATPESLNMWDKADMEAMTASTYDFLKEKRRLQYMEQVERARFEEEEERRNRIEQEEEVVKEAEDRESSSDIEFVGASQRPSLKQTPRPPPNAQPSPNRIRITLRGMNRDEEYKIQIPVEKKCSVLLSSYLTYFKIDHGQASSYELDLNGDRLDLNDAVENTDLEDEDLLNVIKKR
ncbi:hypothetical protein E3P92_02411 [Wallemia ichthyophaga]|uniref:Rad60/SUMO-like domain-containing protein n=2 Tax=Wallemia ichthyophaga TaxID=245174 RepID=A0A4T0I620_WALIC|nr:uncharacterized protein J056_001896 [Wallemia ichthyophaga EXF-994]TIA90614.1 hypothetical protein E3P97_02424 [Wallemia ichthyophaga]EOQ99340.1 hypothetical protein J056_001896 [Wallemia ichthyophaga EXF-994]TIA99414.1 hypothetical protein E3P95_02066 [Wallemia ichthyophaga]TIB00358.1 hypothetical protein E3P94_02190 [Wallemia ichthyophaga]TIB06853.1 hypothetical protein E3P96_00014 [Wallemia ichthyophaga]